MAKRNKTNFCFFDFASIIRGFVDTMTPAVVYTYLKTNYSIFVEYK